MRQLIAGIVLLAFAARALVPQGYMPSRERPLSIEICPEGLPAQLLGHTAHHHSGGPAHSEHCVFGSACPPGPLSELPALSLFSLLESASPAHRTATIVVRRVTLPHARAPPLSLKRFEIDRSHR
jgi:hypothetical protein